MRSFVILKIFIWCWIACFTNGDDRKIKWAAIFPSDLDFFPQANKALELGIQSINSDSSFPFEVEIVPIHMDISAVSTIDNRFVISDAYFKEKAKGLAISGFLGFYSNKLISDIIEVSHELNVPTIIGDSGLFNDIGNNDFIGRVVHSDFDSATTVVDSLFKANIRRVGYISNSEASSIGLFKTLKFQLTEAGIELVHGEFYEGAEGYIQLTEHESETLIFEIDGALMRLKSEGVKVIIYEGHYNEAQLLLWRAYELNMIGVQDNGDEYMWVLTEGLCSPAVVTTCPLQRCEEQQLLVRSALKGSLCVQSIYDIDDDWLNNIWIPNTKTDLLTPEEIALSGTSDWSVHHLPASTFQFDEALLMGRCVTRFCEDSVSQLKYNSWGSCVADVPNKGSEIMNMMSNVIFSGGTGKIILDDERNRVMCHEVLQWVGNSFEQVYQWTPPSLRADNQPSLQPISPVFYPSGDGSPPRTVREADFSHFVSFMVHALIVIAFIIVASMLGILRVETTQDLIQRRLFSDKVTISILILGFIHLFTEFASGYMTLSPSEDFIYFSCILDYSSTLSLLILLLILCQKVVTFNKWINNCHNLINQGRFYSHTQKRSKRLNHSSSDGDRRRSNTSNHSSPYTYTYQPQYHHYYHSSNHSSTTTRNCRLSEKSSSDNSTNNVGYSVNEPIFKFSCFTNTRHFFYHFRQPLLLILVLILFGSCVIGRRKLDVDSLENGSSKDVFSESRVLQDSNHELYFIFSIPIFNLFKDNSLSIMFYFIQQHIIPLMMVLVMFRISRKIFKSPSLEYSLSSIRKSENDFIDIQLFNNILPWIGILLFVNLLLACGVFNERVFGNNENDACHIGFENENSFATVDLVKFYAFRKMAVSFLTCSFLFYLIFKQRIQVIIGPLFANGNENDNDDIENKNDKSSTYRQEINHNDSQSLIVAKAKGSTNRSIRIQKDDDGDDDVMRHHKLFIRRRQNNVNNSNNQQQQTQRSNNQQHGIDNGNSYSQTPIPRARELSSKPICRLAQNNHHQRQQHQNNQHQHQHYQHQQHQYQHYQHQQHQYQHNQHQQHQYQHNQRQQHQYQHNQQDRTEQPKKSLCQHASNHQSGSVSNVSLPDDQQPMVKTLMKEYDFESIESNENEVKSPILLKALHALNTGNNGNDNGNNDSKEGMNVVDNDDDTKHTHNNVNKETTVSYPQVNAQLILQSGALHEFDDDNDNSNTIPMDINMPKGSVIGLHAHSIESVNQVGNVGNKDKINSNNSSGQQTEDIHEIDNNSHMKTKHVPSMVVDSNKLLGSEEDAQYESKRELKSCLNHNRSSSYSLFEEASRKHIQKKRDIIRRKVMETRIAKQDKLISQLNDRQQQHMREALSDKQKRSLAERRHYHIPALVLPDISSVVSTQKLPSERTAQIHSTASTHVHSMVTIPSGCASRNVDNNNINGSKTSRSAGVILENRNKNNMFCLGGSKILVKTLSNNYSSENSSTSHFPSGSSQNGVKPSLSMRRNVQRLHINTNVNPESNSEEPQRAHADEDVQNHHKHKHNENAGERRKNSNHKECISINSVLNQTQFLKRMGNIDAGIVKQLVLRLESVLLTQIQASHSVREHLEILDSHLESLVFQKDILEVRFARLTSQNIEASLSVKPAE